MPRILLVEDNEMNRDMLSRRLVRKGYDVIAARSGEEALSLAVSELPELILMDVGLPGVDGWEATRRLKADDATSGIPVIALTAHALNTDRDRAFQVGCDEYETKPIEFNNLLAKMEQLLARRTSV